MVSSTRQSERRRELKSNKIGRAKRRERTKLGTPAFPVHPSGYDAKAADAKKSAS
ncbi:MAG: hypothetical protein R3B13_37060 [Polyangiaceae bacterium]